jgi:hypothetical protein
MFRLRSFHGASACFTRVVPTITSHVFLTSFMLLISGCHNDQKRMESVGRTPVDTEMERNISLDDQAIADVKSSHDAEAIAVNCLAQDERYSNRRYELASRQSADGWYVFVTFIPKVPGSELVVDVKNNGECQITPMW